MKELELQDRNARAAGTMLLFFGSGFASCVVGAVTGDPVSGFVASPVVGWFAIEAVYASGPAFVNWILAQLRPRASRMEEDAQLVRRYRERAERAAEAPVVDETPRRVDLNAEYRPPEYEPLRPKQHRPPTWAENENAIILD